MTPVLALKATNRQWHNHLPSEVSKEIGRFRFSHPTAPLIKDLLVTHSPEHDAYGVYMPARLQVEVSEISEVNSWFLIPRRPLRGAAYHVRERHYALSDFGDATYDRYQIDSDNASGIVLGRVAGTERWGHQQ